MQQADVALVAWAIGNIKHWANLAAYRCKTKQQNQNY